MGLKDKIIERLASKPETAPATFFDAPAHEDTVKEAKPAKARKTRAKAIPAESQPVQSVDSGVQLQTEIEHPHAAMMRALSRVETSNRDEQPTSATRSEAFRRPSIYNFCSKTQVTSCAVSSAVVHQPNSVCPFASSRF
jgi:hypothetical protein